MRVNGVNGVSERRVLRCGVARWRVRSLLVQNVWSLEQVCTL
jgi:hypothetical protein